MRFTINFEKKHFYLLVSLVIIAGISIAIAVVPNPGHSYDKIEIPDGVWTELDADMLDGVSIEGVVSIIYQIVRNSPPSANADKIESVDVYWDGDDLCFGVACEVQSASCSGNDVVEMACTSVCRDWHCEDFCKEIVACNGDASGSCNGGTDVEYTGGTCFSYTCSGTPSNPGWAECKCTINGVQYQNEIINQEKCTTFS